MLSIYLILVKFTVKTVLADIENSSSFGSETNPNRVSTQKGSGRKSLKIDQKKLEQLQLCQATLEQIIDPSDEEFQNHFDKICFRKSWKNHLLYLNKVILKIIIVQTLVITESRLQIDTDFSEEDC